MPIRENLEIWLNRLEQNNGFIDGWNETEIRFHVIDPLLNALEWNTTNPEIVKPNVSVQMGTETKYADYALKSNTYCCVIEAKAGASDLDDDSCRQAISYAIFLNCHWAIVMNGEKLRLYDIGSFQTNNNLTDSLVKKLDFLQGGQAEREKVLDFLELLAKGMINSPEGEEKLKNYRIYQNIRSFIEDNEERILNDVIPDWVQRKKPEWTNTDLVRNSVQEVFSESYTTTPPNPVQPGGNVTLAVTVAGNWEHKPNLGRGIFVRIDDPNKRINVDIHHHIARNVNDQLRNLGFCCTTMGALNGFVFCLRRTAGLLRQN